MFVVPAYGDSPWLSRCLDSLAQQTKPSAVVITTSTPSARLSAVAAEFGVQLLATSAERGIAADWNFALSQSQATWTTLAHQDDWYDATYTESCLQAVRGVSDIQIVFTASLDRDTTTGSAGNMWFKRLISRVAFASSDVIRSRTRKRFLLSFGNPISCPSVMFHRSVLRDFQFEEGWRSNLDWASWLKLATLPGAFVYLPRVLVHRSLHPDAATTKWLGDRAAEDWRMIRSLWPWPLSEVVGFVYGASRLPYLRIKARKNVQSSDVGPSSESG